MPSVSLPRAPHNFLLLISSRLFLCRFIFRRRLLARRLHVPWRVNAKGPQKHTLSLRLRRLDDGILARFEGVIAGVTVKAARSLLARPRRTQKRKVWLAFVRSPEIELRVARMNS